MKIIKSTPRPNGNTRLIVEIEPDEFLKTCKPGQTILNIDPDAHYKLGQPMGDEVIAGHILADATRAHWCSVGQKWVD